MHGKNRLSIFLRFHPLTRFLHSPLQILLSSPSLYTSLKQQRFCVSYCTTSNRVQKNMATLQRSAVSFRREGSSGSVWDDLYVLGEDGTVHYRDQLRPCQSTRERSSSTPVPNACPRSMSTPAMDPSSLIKVFGKLSREDKPFPEVPKLPQSKSKKHKA
ncbi:hypothetical protein QUC31_019778 [Theobroma cacao]|uniref:Uncharacterized protein LOC108663475 n=1 Tax=Theobroma cacao TaxID=3641 RepID=A0AB32WXF4_THECC|nr:PREDICTED: uncharacterized protein LOC108663475 [Theobroma cacao]